MYFRACMKHFLIASTILVSTNVFAQKFTLMSENTPGNNMPLTHTLSADYGFGCSGDNISPKLSWKNPPKNTKSYVLTMYDPDAPTGIGWMHWVLVNIPKEASEIPAGINQSPQNIPLGAIQTQTDFGLSSYGGPCPPEGETHRYIITLTALNIEKLEVNEKSTPALVGFLTHAHSLGSASIMITYGR